MPWVAFQPGRTVSTLPLSAPLRNGRSEYSLQMSTHYLAFSFTNLLVRSSLQLVTAAPLKIIQPQYTSETSDPCQKLRGTENKQRSVNVCPSPNVFSLNIHFYFNFRKANAQVEHRNTYLKSVHVSVNLAFLPSFQPPPHTAHPHTVPPRTSDEIDWAIPWSEANIFLGPTRISPDSCELR